MTKKLIITLLTVCLAVVGMTVMAFADTVSGNGWSLDTSTGVLTISSDAGMTDWTNNGRNTYGSSVKSVDIQSGVAYISERAFYSDCTNLESVSIPDTVTTIGDHAFEYCSSLTSITIPSSVTSIGGSVFAQSGLTSITIPSSVTSIGAYAFYRCSSLTSVTIPSGVTSIGIYAFYGCTNLTSVKLESCKTEIGNKAFDNTAAYTNGNIVTNHSLIHVQTQLATCTEAGNSEYFYCSVCEGYFSDTAGAVPTSLSAVTIAATGHQNVTQTEYKSATCTEDGNIEYWYCSDCKCYFSDAYCTQEITQTGTILSALGHNLTKTEAVAATCDTDGTIEYWYCSNCGKYFSDENAEN